MVSAKYCWRTDSALNRYTGKMYKSITEYGVNIPKDRMFMKRGVEMRKLDEWLIDWLDETIEKGGEYGALKVFAVIGIAAGVIGVGLGMMLK